MATLAVTVPLRRGHAPVSGNGADHGESNAKNGPSLRQRRALYDVVGPSSGGRLSAGARGVRTVGPPVNELVSPAGTRMCTWRQGRSRRRRLCKGTEGSNPLSSSAESSTNRSQWRHHETPP